VTMAAIQGLYQLVQSQSAVIRQLRMENVALQERLEVLEARLAALE